jgi:hypothetical protein
VFQDKKRKRPPTETSSPCSSIDYSAAAKSKLSAAQLSKKLRLVKEEDSSAAVSAEEESNSLLNADDDDDEDRLSDGGEAFVDADDNAVSREPTRPASPLFDFLGEKLGPKRCRARTGGKRGRPRGQVRILLELASTNPMAIKYNNFLKTDLPK